MSTAAFSIPRPTWRHLFWRYPEWWAIMLSACAWFFLIAERVTEFSVSPFSWAAHAGHASENFTAFPRSFSFVPAFMAWRGLAIHWLLMVAAMMFPTLIGQLRAVADRSFWSRRNRSVAIFLLGYTVFWLTFGVFAEAVLGFRQLLPAGATVYFIPTVFFLSALWQLSPQKRHGLIACHVTRPLAALGFRADLDCLRHGLRVSVGCCVSCWALMLACAAAGHASWAVLAVTLIVWSERMQPRPRQLWRSVALFALVLFAFITQSKLCP